MIWIKYCPILSHTNCEVLIYILIIHTLLYCEWSCILIDSNISIFIRLLLSVCARNKTFCKTLFPSVPYIKQHIYGTKYSAISEWLNTHRYRYNGNRLILFTSYSITLHIVAHIIHSRHYQICNILGALTLFLLQTVFLLNIYPIQNIIF